MKINSIIDLVKDLDTSRQTKNLNKLLIRILLHLQVEFSNRADTAELKKIPGIGSGIARLIVNYRQRLGGFYQIEQLQEIHLNYRQLQAWFTVTPSEIRRINLNRVGIERLRHHPYINFYQAKALVEYRKKKGALHSLKPFTLYEEFTESDLERLSPYVCFE